MSRRNIGENKYLKISRSDRISARVLKETILSESNDEQLVKDLTAIICKKDNEALRVRPEVLMNGVNTNSILHFLDCGSRAREIVASINSDGDYFKLLVEAANFIEARRLWNSNNIETMRKKYLNRARRNTRRLKNVSGF